MQFSSFRSRLPVRLSFANVVSSLAVLVMLCGTAFAAGVLPARSVGTRQLKTGAVTSGRVKNGSLAAGDIAAGQLPRGPRGATGATGPAGPAGAVDTAGFSTKADADGRYLRGALVTVVATSATIASGSAGTATVTCPTGDQAVSGGADIGIFDNTILVVGSAPMIDATPLAALTDGQHGAPNAWHESVFNAGSPRTFKVAVVCAPFR